MDMPAAAHWPRTAAQIAEREHSASSVTLVTFGDTPLLEGLARAHGIELRRLDGPVVVVEPGVLEA